MTSFSLFNHKIMAAETVRLQYEKSSCRTGNCTEALASGHFNISHPDIDGNYVLI